MKVEISVDRLHELARPIGIAHVEAVGPVLTKYAFDDSISPEEFSCLLIYVGCQQIDAALSSAVAKGANREQLLELAVGWLRTGFEDERGVQQ